MTVAFGKIATITSWLPCDWRGIYMKSQNSPEPKANGRFFMGECGSCGRMFFEDVWKLTCVWLFLWFFDILWRYVFFLLLPVSQKKTLDDDMLMLSLLESPWFIMFHLSNVERYGHCGISEGKWWNLQHPLWSLADNTSSQLSELQMSHESLSRLGHSVEKTGRLNS